MILNDKKILIEQKHDKTQNKKIWWKQYNSVSFTSVQGFLQ